MKLFTRAAIASVFLLASSVAFAKQVPNFSFKDIDGQQHQFSQYRGKWVIVNYWATYCGPCVAELPALNSIAKRFKDRVVVLGMEAGETPTDELQAFAQDHQLAYPIVPTSEDTLFKLGMVMGVPTTFIVNPEGKIVDTHMGAVSARQLQSYIRQDDRGSAAALGKKKEESCVTGLC